MGSNPVDAQTRGDQMDEAGDVSTVLPESELEHRGTVESSGSHSGDGEDSDVSDTTANRPMNETHDITHLNTDFEPRTVDGGAWVIPPLNLPLESGTSEGGSSARSMIDEASQGTSIGDDGDALTDSLSARRTLTPSMQPLSPTHPRSSISSDPPVHSLSPAVQFFGSTNRIYPYTTESDKASSPDCQTPVEFYPPVCPPIQACYPPMQPQQCSDVTVVGGFVRPDWARNDLDRELRMSYFAATVLACAAFWCCGVIFGSIALLIIVVSKNVDNHDARQIRRMIRTSCMFSVAGIISGVVVVIILAIIFGTKSLSSTPYCTGSDTKASTTNGNCKYGSYYYTEQQCKQCCGAYSTSGCTAYGSYRDENGCQVCCMPYSNATCALYGSYRDANNCKICCQGTSCNPYGSYLNARGCRQCCAAFNDTRCSIFGSFNDTNGCTVCL